jgi:hypothetical protein
VRSMVATRHPRLLSTVKARHQHRVKELRVRFWTGLPQHVTCYAEWWCGNRGGSMASPLVERPELPLCEKCESKYVESIMEGLS